MFKRRLQFLILTAFMAGPGLAHAKDRAATPRDQFVAFLGGVVPPAPVSPSEIDSPEPEPAPAPVYPFYLSAGDYLSKRGADDSTQLRLTYKIKVGSAKSSLTVPPTQSVLTIGPDFAMIDNGKARRIFDFKTNRLLSVKDTDDGPVFDNISLYVGAYKTIDTVSRATQGGTVSEISIGPDKTLDSFWLESSLGWSARETPDGLTVTRGGEDITATYNNLAALSMKLSGPALPSEDHMRSFFAYLNHDAAIHPTILPQIGRPERAPETMTLLSFSPNFPNGLKTEWSLLSSGAKMKAFPLPAAARTSLEMSKTSDLAKTIAAAAKREALDQRPTNNDLRQEIFDKKQAGKNFEAWITGMMLADRLGGCAHDPALLCQDLKDLEAGAQAESPLANLPAIMRLAQNKDTRETGLLALIPYIDGGIAPAFLAKFAGHARSKLKTGPATDPQVKALSADKLLEEALSKDPYDVNSYKILAQIYAAQGRFAESWDLQDAMRALPENTDAASRQITGAENKIQRSAPGFFITD